MRAVITWFIIHVLSPLFPFFLEGFLRFSVFQECTIDTFSASTLAMSQGLLFILVAQSLSGHEIQIPSIDDIGEKESWVKICFGIAMFSIALFGVNVFCSALISHEKIDIPQIAIFLKTSIFVGSMALAMLTFYIQSHFNLKVK